MDIETPHLTASNDVHGDQMRTTVVDLPTELILLIARDLGPTDLLSLAVLCRRLHHIALPLYFNRKGVQDIRGHLKVTFIDDYIPGLKMALFLDYARGIRFTFRNSPHLPRDMREAAHLISRFTRLDQVTLNFRIVTFRQSVTSPWVTNTHGMTALTPPIRSLLEAIHAKSCTTLRVCYGRIETNPGQSFDLAREMKMSRNLITSLIRKATWSQKGSNWQSAEFPGPPLCFLRCFHFNSNILLWQPLLDWTLQTFGRSSRSLVELSFRHLCLKTSDWAYLLPLISLPSLKTLALATKSLNFSDLVLFLQRHPHIELLSLCGGELRTGHEELDPLPAALFPALTRLNGPADYMLHFLRNSEQFPHLVDVEIRSVKRLSPPPERLARQNAALALVAKLVPASKWVRVTIALFREILYPHSVTPVPVASETEEIMRSLLNVSGLELFRVDNRFTLHREPALVARWLALFPALRDVTFSQGFFPATYNETGKCAFVEQIMVACPQMEYVAIGNDRRPAATWRRSSA